MEYYLDQLPEIIIRRIKEYTPKDKDMKSPTSSHIKSLLYHYNYNYDKIYRLIDEWQEHHSLDDVNPFDEYVFYIPHNNEPFYEYALRIYKEENINNYTGLKYIYTLDSLANNWNRLGKFPSVNNLNKA